MLSKNNQIVLERKFNDIYKLSKSKNKNYTREIVEIIDKFNLKNKHKNKKFTMWYSWTIR